MRVSPDIRHLEEPKPVVVALDFITDDEIKNFVGAIDEVDRSRVALQLRHRYSRQDDAKKTKALRKQGWEVRSNTSYSGYVRKHLLETVVLDCEETDIETPLWFPNYITAEPPTTTDEEEKKLYQDEVERLEKLGIGVIGIGRPDLYHPSDLEHICGQAHIAFDRAVALKMTGFETTFDALTYASEMSDVSIFRDKKTHLIVSKLTQIGQLPSIDLVQANAAKAFNNGASTILIGDTIIGADDPRFVIEAVLAAHEEPNRSM